MVSISNGPEQIWLEGSPVGETGDPPLGRYCIVLVDVLLDSPVYVRMDKSPFNIGLQAGAADCDWVLPLPSMGVDFVLQGLEPECRHQLKVTFTYMNDDLAWSIPPTSSCSCPILQRHPFIEMQTMADYGVFRPVKKRHFLTPMECFKLSLRELNAIPPNRIASFTFIFLDLQESQSPGRSLTSLESRLISNNDSQFSSPSSASKQNTQAPSGPHLLSLPDVPLAEIFSHLDPIHCVQILPIIASSDLHPRIAGMVPWKELDLRRTDPLNAIRVARLAQMSPSLKNLKIVEFVALYICRQKKLMNEIYQRFPRLDTNAHIVELTTDDIELLRVAGVPKNLKKLHLDGWHWSSSANWEKLIQLEFPNTLSSLVLEFVDNNGRNVHGFFDCFPFVRHLTVDFCPGPPFWDATSDACRYEPLPLERLSAVVSYWSIVPWRRLGHLRVLSLDFGDLEDGELDVLRRVFADCAGCYLPHLEAFGLRCFGSGDIEAVDGFFKNLQHAAPNLAALKFTDSTFFEVKKDTTDAVIKNFPNVKVLLGRFGTIKSTQECLELLLRNSPLIFVSVEIFGELITPILSDDEIKLNNRGRSKGLQWNLKEHDGLFQKYQCLNLKFAGFNFPDDDEVYYRKLFEF